MKQRSSMLTVLALTGLLSACAATAPLSITLHHPKSNVVRKCAARETTPQQIQMLAGAVEACAKQLEARGFVRVSDSFNVDGAPPDTGADRQPAPTP